MISPEGERVGLTKVRNIIIYFFVNEQTLAVHFIMKWNSAFQGSELAGQTMAGAVILTMK